jgi:hypothetical protein
LAASWKVGGFWLPDPRAMRSGSAVAVRAWNAASSLGAGRVNPTTVVAACFALEMGCILPVREVAAIYCMHKLSRRSASGRGPE